MAFIESWHANEPEYFVVEQGHNLTYPLHSHYCYELITLLSGNMTINVDGEEFLLETGQMALIFPNQIHSLKSNNECKHLLVIFAPDMISRYYHQTLGFLPTSPIFHPDSNTLQMFKNITNDDSIYKIKGLLYLLIDTFKTNNTLSKQKKPNKQQSLLYDIINYIQTNCYGECTLTGLCDNVKYDYSYISKFFKNNVGVTFGEYVNRLRIEHACYLLKNTENTVLEIGSNCGFGSLRTFNRCFMEYTGKTPTEWRFTKEE